MEKLCDPVIKNIVNENKQKFEPFAELVGTTITDYRTDLTRNTDAFTQQGNDESAMIEPEIDDPGENEALLFQELGQLSIDRSTLIPDSEINYKIRSLNTNQREIFEVINKWARDYVKHSSCLLHKSISPLHLFITGSEGCGKYHLIKTVYNLLLSKTLTSKSSDKPRVLLLAQTGVAAVDIDGMTIHSGLGIPISHHGMNIPRLSDKMCSQLKNKLSGVSVVIIDEISMVSNILLLYIHQRLVQVFECAPDKPFAGISIIVFGDFYRLPPIQQRTIYAEYNDTWLNFSHL